MTYPIWAISSAHPQNHTCVVLLQNTLVACSALLQNSVLLLAMNFCRILYGLLAMYFCKILRKLPAVLN